MIFSGGMGVGLVFWGVAEPMMHLSSPPLGIGTPGTVEASLKEEEGAHPAVLEEAEIETGLESISDRHVVDAPYKENQ